MTAFAQEHRVDYAKYRMAVYIMAFSSCTTMTHATLRRCRRAIGRWQKFQRGY